MTTSFPAAASADDTLAAVRVAVAARCCSAGDITCRACFRTADPDVTTVVRVTTVPARATVAATTPARVDDADVAALARRSLRYRRGWSLWRWTTTMFPHPRVNHRLYCSVLIRFESCCVWVYCPFFFLPERNLLLVKPGCSRDKVAVLVCSL